MGDVEEVVIQGADDGAAAVREDSGGSPAVGVEAVPATVPQPVAAPQETEPPLPTEVAGLRAAVSSERAEKKTYREQAAQLQQQLDQVQQQVASMGPYVAFLQANPHLFDANAQKPATPAAPTETAPDPRDVEYAQTLDLWTADGKPDVKRAAKFRAMAIQDAQQEAQRLVQPLQAKTVEDQSRINYQNALQTIDVNGQKPDPQYLSAVWQRMGSQMTSTTDGAALAVMLATGAKVMATKNQPAAPVNPPIFTEPSGGSAAQKTALSALEDRIRIERGMSPTQWAERTTQYKSGQPTVMEE